MGGPGSGRIADPVRTYVEQKAAVAVMAESGEPLLLPNFSGLRNAQGDLNIHAEAGDKLMIKAPDSYFIFEGGKVCIYVNGVKKASWG